MQKIIYSLCFTLSIVINIYAQQPKKLSSSEIYESVQKLNVLASALYVAAHPDDENTRLIAYLSNHDKARTAYLSLTRGDGGQNLIGPEIRELLGVIRTQELLGARGVDGGEQWFTRANDFGYSKHPDETFEIWNKNKVLADVVWAIRNFKPDVIINRFDHRSPGTTHGHHTGSAMLSMEAFDLANSKTAYPSQLQYTEPWQPKRLFFNTSWWFYGSREKFEKADKSNMLNVDVGVYYPQKGVSNNEVAALASSQHLCQGFGRLSTRGTQKEYVELLKGDMPTTNSIFEGIDTSWNRIDKGQQIGALLNPIEQNFNFKNPAAHLDDLLQAYRILQTSTNNHWKAIKSKQLMAIIEACAGLYLEASATTDTATPGDTVTIEFEALNRSNANIELKTYSVNTNKSATPKQKHLKNNEKLEFEDRITIPLNTAYSTPYWLNDKGSLGMYKVDKQDWIGKPETPRPITVTFHLNINGQPLEITKNVVHRYSKPDKGELYKPFEIIPVATAKISEKVIIFKDNTQKEIEVIVSSGRDSISGDITLAHPKDWEVYPYKQKVNIATKGDQQKLIFTVIPPKQQSEGYISPIVTIDGKAYTKEHIEIDYNHIPFQNVLLPSESKVVKINIKKHGKAIAYIQGAGDVVPENLRQIGYDVTILKPDAITPENLSRFDAVVVGIRAYNTVETLKFKQQFLFDFVKQGGNMIVQYNTSHRVKVDPIAPYHLKLSRDRVTDEYAEVRFLNPEHQVLHHPNTITQDDFKGWVQERGLYFPNEWGDEFTPILSLNDKGESAKKGSLLAAKHGKGYYIYTGLSFFREFPAGVPGAFRLFANMLSIGKEE